MKASDHLTTYLKSNLLPCFMVPLGMPLANITTRALPESLQGQIRILMLKFQICKTHLSC